MATEIIFDSETSGKLPLNSLLKLQAHYGSLKSAEKKAADFLTSNSELVAKSTLAKSAEMAGCSGPTFVRLARKLGYSGFAEMKEELNMSKESQQSKGRFFGRFSSSQSSEEIVTGVFQISIQALNDTLKIFDFEKYKQAFDALKNAKKIVFFGIGDAAAVAMSAYVKFTRIGFNCQVANDPDLMLMHSANMRKGDVGVMISHSGRTKCLVNSAKYLRSKGVTVLSITNFPITPLVKNSDICIMTCAYAEHLKGEVMAIRVVGLCIIESLFIDILAKDHEHEVKMNKCNEAVKINKL
ncbi:MAG TPA: MurR/RpiR family transcriptional regulator [Desulfitobacteriaceae bacterium]|nr:MurR/RpiR family transcriptional regulator [Desulfitobacteriaceae bacterium]